MLSQGVEILRRGGGGAWVVSEVVGDTKEDLGGGFKYLLFSPLFVEMIQFDGRIFFKWVGEKPPTRDDGLGCRGC